MWLVGMHSTGLPDHSTQHYALAWHVSLVSVVSLSALMNHSYQQSNDCVHTITNMFVHTIWQAQMARWLNNYIEKLILINNFCTTAHVYPSISRWQTGLLMSTDMPVDRTWLTVLWGLRKRSCIWLQAHFQPAQIKVGMPCMNLTRVFSRSCIRHSCNHIISKRVQAMGPAEFPMQWNLGIEHPSFSKHCMLMKYSLLKDNYQQL